MARALTAGEIAMASTLFGDAIDYARVRIHNRRYLPYLQPKNCAMSPNGSLYFHRSRCRDDFSLAPAHERRWFMHEMVHVWQHQLGYPVRLRGAVRIGLDYRYHLRPGATLADFNMEAQGDLLADYFMLAADDPVRPLYEQVLGSFLADPSDRRHLPSLW
ncbi:MAG: Rhs element Vgr protein [Massilia sp.]|nr:Rhs element Vgr protein [Massilia sp.]